MGFFDKLGKILSGAADMTGDMARHSNDIDVALRYIEIFNNRVENADLETLEKMLARNEYQVTMDSSNDYARQRRIEERIWALRQERDQQIAEDRKNFDSWLSNANIDELESGLSSWKYQIRYDSQKDSERRARLEEKLRPLQEVRDRERAERERREKGEKEKNDAARMRQLFQDYLEKTETELYRSYYVFCDFRRELSCLQDFQREILEELYAGPVDELLSKPAEELKEVISNYTWQVNKRKTVAGKSLLLLMLAEGTAEGEAKSLIQEALTAMETAVIHNTYFQDIDAEDRGLSPGELLGKGKEALLAGKARRAAGYYLLAAEGNEPEAMYRLGFCFLYGLGAPGNNDKAFFWLSKAAEQRSPEGIYGLGVCYYWGYGVKKDVRHAVELYREAFSLGCAAGAYGLGGYYESEGEEKNLQSSFEWYLKSANGGCLNGAYCVYVDYCNGTGVERNDLEACEWITKTVEAAGREESLLEITAYAAFNNLGRAFYNGWTGTGGKNEARALEWFKRGTAVGYHVSKTWLIDFDEYEGRNRILRELAEENYSWALNQLAGFYDSGKGFPEEDKVLANYYYLKAAKYEDSNSQYYIGMAYLEGRPGIRQNTSQAISWLEKAAAKGSGEAQKEIDAYKERLERQRLEQKEQEEKEQREKMEAGFQERRNAVLEQKTALDGQMSELQGQLKEINDKIDSAASEKEEAAAIAEKEEVQGKIDELDAQLEAVSKEMAALEDEASLNGYTVN